MNLKKIAMPIIISTIVVTVTLAPVWAGYLLPPQPTKIITMPIKKGSVGGGQSEDYVIDKVEKDGVTVTAKGFGEAIAVTKKIANGGSEK